MFHAYHREIDVGGIEFHVDLLVDQRLAVLVVVLPDLGHGHLDRLVGLGVGELKKGKV